MTKTWVYSDPHFSSWGVCKFLRADGITKLRPWNNPIEMDEALIEKYNAVVKDEDRVYFLGDVVMRRKDLPILSRLKGRKCLIRGNHDLESAKDYLKYFDDVRGCIVKKFGEHRTIFTHYPIHPESLGENGLCIHGHLHANLVMKDSIPDTRYINVCVEQTNFEPAEIFTLLKKHNIKL